MCSNKDLLAEVRQETREREIAQELFEMQEYTSRWRATLRARFDENNGCEWVRYLRNHFDTDSVFRAVKKTSSAEDIYTILTKRRA